MPAFPRFWTLRRRIAILALAPAALLAAGGGLWLRAHIHSAIYQSFAHHLHEESESLAARLHVDGARIYEEASGAGPFGVIYSGWYWQAQGSGIDGRSRSLWDATPLAATPAPAAHRLALLQATDPRGVPLLGVQRQAAIPGAGAPVHLTVFGPAGELRASVQRIDFILLASAATLIAALAAMLLVQLRVGLAPLRRLTSAVAAQREDA